MVLFSRVGDAQADDRGVGPLLEALDGVLQRGEKAKRADPTFIQEIRDLLSGYRPVARSRLLWEDFSDGDWTRNPIWVVSQGNFRVDGNGALLSSVSGMDDTLPMQQGGITVEQGRKESDMAQLFGLMKTLSSEGHKEGGKKSRRKSDTLAVIHTAMPISNGFDLWFTLRAGVARGTAGVGLYTDQVEQSGYRLMLHVDPASNQSLSLVRFDQGRSQMIRWAGGLYLGDGLIHRIRWQRLDGGQMSVWVDGMEMLRARNSSLWEGFSGLVLINNQGEFAFDDIQLQAME